MQGAEVGRVFDEDAVVAFEVGRDQGECLLGAGGDQHLRRVGRESPVGEVLDYEIELGVVIGRIATRVDASAARHHVAGYCVVNDITERTWQLHRGGTWDKGKAHDTFAPIGPWFVTADEIIDPHDLVMELAIDGETRQHANTNDMHVRIDLLISYISHFMTLHPGDLITAGTPSGTALGTTTHGYLQPGQLVTATIDGLGTQHTPVVSPVSTVAAVSG